MPGYELMGQEERSEVESVFDNGGVLFRHGFDGLRSGSYKVQEFESEFCKMLNGQHCLAVTSGTAALRVALASLGIGPGDEVITQCFTFVATVEAIIESGATPICTDIDDTLNMCPDDLGLKITEKTKAVIVVHMLGVPARLDRIRKICTDLNIFLIEDTAWGCGGSLDGQKLGTWGDVAAFSFDYAKTITTGEGGMLHFKQKKHFQLAAAWHDHGHENNPSVPRWEDTRSGSGFNYRMMELQGAVGLAQLRKLDEIIMRQQRVSSMIWQAIADLPGVSKRTVPEGANCTADALVFMVESSGQARACRQSLLEIGVSTKILPEAYTWHFAGTWTHMPELVQAHDGDLATSFQKSHERLSRAVSLPISLLMRPELPAGIRRAMSAVVKQR